MGWDDDDYDLYTICALYLAGSGLYSGLLSLAGGGWRRGAHGFLAPGVDALIKQVMTTLCSSILL
ncbi:uncharacterized protein CC84DRAFT_60552 [Paraphaeosphaeria sporulosa]|uniref:Uncharacterized protein n=1 Tax=Paraphaeosphaeria sporulosa TaxID=1460663 RepID=A0A177CXI4_9PLEO|nr:uncharacterized protein CC84DRAFT_60552 [Paraphaeosphaeria sporulosa]OAG11911.1 hypothetical protein CC84DRAFT_60552 [Paraphaeosphaeria sporulosa]